MNKKELWKKQGGYKTLGLRGNEKGVKMVLVMGEDGGTELQPVSKSKTKKEVAKKMR